LIFTRENPGEIGCLAFGEGDSQPVTEGRRKEKREGRLSRGPELTVEGVGGVRSSADEKEEKEARALGRERELGRARGARRRWLSRPHTGRAWAASRGKEKQARGGRGKGTGLVSKGWGLFFFFLFSFPKTFSK